MIVKETKNRQEIEKIFFDEEMQKRINPKGYCFEIPINESFKYIAGYVDGEIVALFVYHYRENITTCHMQVLKSHRAALAVKFGRMALEFEPSKTLFTNINKKFTDVIRFVKYFKFKHVDTVGEYLIFKRG